MSESSHVLSSGLCFDISKTNAALAGIVHSAEFLLRVETESGAVSAGVFRMMLAALAAFSYTAGPRIGKSAVLLFFILSGY
jgi:hypothetical protein